MSMKYDGGPAFPVDQETTEFGISLRDYFAAHAPITPQSWFESSEQSQTPIETSGVRTVIYDKKKIAIEWPWAWADAMIEARDK